MLANESATLGGDALEGLKFHATRANCEEMGVNPFLCNLHTPTPCECSVEQCTATYFLPNAMTNAGDGVNSMFGVR